MMTNHMFPYNVLVIYPQNSMVVPSTVPSLLSFL